MTAGYDLAELLEYATPAEQAALIRGACRDDNELFVLTFFAERFEYGFSAMHRDILSRPKEPWTTREARINRALAAPRGNAKSTLVSYADVAHDIVYGFERFVVLISTTSDLSDDLVKDLYDLFTTPESAPEFHAVYGPFAVRGGMTDFIAKSPHGDPRGTRVWASSLNGTIRGKKYAGIRPTRIILDDYEHPKHVNSAIQRTYSWNFLNADIGKAGRKGTIVDMLGTVLHTDAVLARVLKSAGWIAKKWASVISWPTNQALWSECHRIWSALDDPDRMDHARAFYAEHQAEMDKGAAVLWPEGEALYDLYVMRWTEGDAAFWRDKQNDPRDPTSMFFDVERFRRCRWDKSTGTLERLDEKGGVVARWRLPQLEVAIFHDRSKGGSHNDFPATAVVARDPHGYRYVLEVVLDQEPTSAQRARVWRLWESYRTAARVVVGADDTAQTELFAGESWERERQERQKRGSFWNLSVQSVTFDEEKNARIKSLEPDTLNGWLMFAELSEEVMGMFRDFPNATHDDAPDAIQAACWLLGGHMPTINAQNRG